MSYNNNNNICYLFPPVSSSFPPPLVKIASTPPYTNNNYYYNNRNLKIQCCLEDNNPKYYNNYNTNNTTNSSIAAAASSSSPQRRRRQTIISISTSILLLSARCCSSASADMESGAGTVMYPANRCKTLHLVRHAQGIHNVEGEKNPDAYLSSALFDAELTSLGWEQVDNLRNHVNKSGLAKKIDLVVVSPLLRTMQTAVGVFGGGSYANGINIPPLMVENAGNSSCPAVSSANCPPFVAVEYCREHLGVHPCDKRRSITEYRSIFPAIDFSLIENDDDVLWKPDVREKNEEVAARGMKLINWLWTRKEKEIAVVSHSGFLFHTLSMYGKDCHPAISKEISKHFANCELRSMVLVDRSMLGSGSPN